MSIGGLVQHQEPCGQMHYNADLYAAAEPSHYLATLLLRWEAIGSSLATFWVALVWE